MSYPCVDPNQASPNPHASVDEPAPLIDLQAFRRQTRHDAAMEERVAASREDEDVVRAGLARFLMGDTSTQQFEAWIYESQALERVVGAAEYAEIAGTDFRSADATAVLRGHLERLIEHRWPGARDRAEAQVACEGIIDGSIDLVRGCAILGALAKRGVEGVPTDFLVWDDEFDGYPTADRYALWDPAALKRKLEFVDGLRDEIVRAAREVLDRLKTTLGT